MANEMEKTVPRSISMRPSVWDRMRETAQANGRSLSGEIAVACVEHMDRQEMPADAEQVE